MLTLLHTKKKIKFYNSIIFYFNNRSVSLVSNFIIYKDRLLAWLFVILKVRTIIFLIT